MIIGQTSEMYLCQQASKAEYSDERTRKAIEQKVISAVPEHCTIKYVQWQPSVPSTQKWLGMCDFVTFLACYEQVKW